MFQALFFTIFFASHVFASSDFCPAEHRLLLPSNVMCPDSEPDCYEPSSRWDLGIAIFNGIFKSAKAYSKYIGENRFAAVAGGLNSLADFVLVGVKGNMSSKETLIFVTRTAREVLRFYGTNQLRTVGSLEDMDSEPIVVEPYNVKLLAKAVLKVPLIVEKNLDWGDPLTSSFSWIFSSAPGLVLSLAEHYARYYRLHRYRAEIGLLMSAFEMASFSSMCTRKNETELDLEEETYKNVRQMTRIFLHLIQYSALYLDADFDSRSKYKKFTFFVVLEHVLMSLADLGYYALYLGPKSK